MYFYKVYTFFVMSEWIKGGGGHFLIGTNCFPTGLANKLLCFVVMGSSSPKNICCGCVMAGGGKRRGAAVPGSWPLLRLTPMLLLLLLTPMKLLMMSMGTGKMMVELFSAEMLLRVCRYRN